MGSYAKTPSRKDAKKDFKFQIPNFKSQISDLKWKASDVKYLPIGFLFFPLRLCAFAPLRKNYCSLAHFALDPGISSLAFACRFSF